MVSLQLYANIFIGIIDSTTYFISVAAELISQAMTSGMQGKLPVLFRDKTYHCEKNYISAQQACYSLAKNCYIPSTTLDYFYM